jgi:hypothetical protein
VDKTAGKGATCATFAAMPNVNFGEAENQADAAKVEKHVMDWYFLSHPLCYSVSLRNMNGTSKTGLIPVFLFSAEGGIHPSSYF